MQVLKNNIHPCLEGYNSLNLVIGTTAAEILKVQTYVANLRYTMALHASLGGRERNPFYPLTLKRMIPVLLQPTLPSVSPLRLKRDKVSSCLELPVWEVKYIK